ncbi:hypothetical protein Rhom172_2096 [Rhodothermus marinus SG0.5JP17-172]|jgi:methyl-accepting chemotaxis protein|uniref:hypothetical protein n=1 Tax=Rhodothermus marinus TaxID=29549 RepID=UPI000223D8FD|nr:hypothetical protein [Rhodothermus marinus]AEN73998.1 hypothetical protein Rhom172_2096 [Rhodothermus marinus SG0.5JP17-172]MBO2492955.1 hypothetical protein [Rhodothermus marinus]
MKLVLRIALAIVFFLIGVVGMYFAMPYIAPQRVQQVQRQLDSLRQINSALADSVRTDSLAPDTLALLIDSLVATRDTLQQLRDSLRSLYQQMNALQQALTQTQSHLQQTQQQLAVLERRRIQAQELATTITRLEDDQRRALLSQLSPEILDMLYLETQGRGRTLLLQSLPPEQAARLVSRLIQKQEPMVTSVESQ